MLQIKTDSEIGISGRVNIRLFSASTTTYNKDLTNFLGINIRFVDPIEYIIYPCMEKREAFSSLPEGREKTWGIQKWYDKILVFCNGELVLEYSVPVDHECYDHFKQLLKRIVFVKEDNGADDNSSLAYKASSQHGEK